MSNKENSDPLETKVVEWLSREGYPLEFFTANRFHESGFRVFQGYYTGDSRTEPVREIDVLAHTDRSVEEGLIRVEYVVECKYAKGKPWAVFTSKHSSITSKACIAQTIGSNLGQTLLWLVADNKKLHNTSAFSTPASPGFGGRQAFSKDNDIFFAAMQSVVSKALSIANTYDRHSKKEGTMPKYASVVLPVIVIDGELFEVLYDKTSDSVTVRSAQMLRLHWRGSEAWRLHSTVDIIRKDHLKDYVSRIKSEIPTILDALEDAYRTVAECFRKESLEPFEAATGYAGRGIAGVPPLLLQLSKQKKKR